MKNELTEVEKLKKYLAGEMQLANDELVEMKMSYEEDCACMPYADDWRHSGYSSYEEWHKTNKEDLDAMDKSLCTRKKLLDAIEAKYGKIS